MTPGAVAALGIGQCVNWGVLYYAFAVLVLPLERELGVPTWAVTGAFSLALLVSAAFAPAVGRWGDRDRGAWMMQAGGFTAAALLAVWTVLPGVLTLYIVWAGLGLCMAATLYEPAFVIVGRAYEDSETRLRALAAVTLFGGLASTVFLPAAAYLVAAVEWRGAVLVLAGLLVASTSLTRALVFRHLRFPVSPEPAVHAPSGGHPDPLRFLVVAATFALASLASAAFTANLVPALGERGIGPPGAAMLGGLIGVMQLPGRALLMHGVLTGPPSRLLAMGLALQGAGLAGIALASSVPLAAGATSFFALGAGLTTLVRPHLVHAMFSSRSGGYLNGRIARQQQLARAAGPLAVAWLGGLVGYTAALGAIGAALGVMALASAGALARTRRFPFEEETV